MTDLIDDAQAKEEAERAAAIAALRINPFGKRDELFCLHCGVEIPDARRRAMPGCMHCIDCQSDIEEGR